MRDVVTSAISIAELEDRYGLAVRRHRIGETDLRFAEVVRADEFVREVYAEALAGGSEAPTWPLCWPAAYGLAEYVTLIERPAGRTVLELGCGSAVPGVAAERAGAAVLATDVDPLALALARHNAALNGCTNIRFEKLDWFSPGEPDRHDLVIASDVVFVERTYGALLSTMRAALAPGGRALLSDPQRPQMDEFLVLARSRGWTVADHRVVVHLAEATHVIRIRELRRRASTESDHPPRHRT